MKFTEIMLYLFDSYSFLQLKDVEKAISKRIKDLDTFWVSEECGSPMSEDISVA